MMKINITRKIKEALKDQMSRYREKPGMTIRHGK